MLALCRASALSLGEGVPVPLDSYERELLEEFLEQAKEAIFSPGTQETSDLDD